MNFSELKVYLDALVEQGVPSVDCKVCKDGQEVFRHMTGYSDAARQQPMRGDELYWIYSASKVLTCAGALRLVERGLLGLDDPVSRYLPEYAKLRVIAPDGGTSEAKNVLTVRHLFTMSGGFSYDLEAGALMRQLATGKSDTRSMIAALSEEPLHFEPGTHFLYSLCHDVLATVVQVVAGKRFGAYMRENIFDPLGMVDTHYNLPADRENRLAAQYRHTEEGKFEFAGSGNKFHWPDYESGGAGLLSSVDDYMKFAAAMAGRGKAADGYQVLQADTIDLMRTQQLFGQQHEDFGQFSRPGYGYGLGVRTLVDKSFGALSPLGEFGWDGAAGAFVVIDVENNVAMVYAQHVLGHSPVYDVVHPALRNTLYRCLAK